MRKLIACGLVALAVFAVYQSATGNGYGTEGYPLGKVRPHFGADSECLVILPSGPGIAPSSCTTPVAGTARAVGPAMPIPAPAPCGASGDAAILATIRQVESAGQYGIGPNAGGASGAYQFIQSTWDSTARAAGRADLVGVGPWKASPADQDALALVLVRAALNGTTDVSRIPVVWYVGSIPPPLGWDVIPAPGAGNKLTPREYQHYWMGIYAHAGGACAA